MVVVAHDGAGFVSSLAPLFNPLFLDLTVC